MSLQFTILGCGSSGGVPRIGGHWGQCDPDNPKNRRRRCSLLVRRSGPDGTTNVLIDTSPDMRQQLLDAQVGWIDGVLYTHEHADHIHGIDDLRVVAINGRQRINVWAGQRTHDHLLRSFGYCFEQPPGSEYPPICDANLLHPDRNTTVEGPGGPITARPFEQIHGSISSLGFRIGGLAYSSDLHDLPDRSLETLTGLDIWIVDALRRTPHPSHFSLDDALGWIERLKPKRAILTNMHVDLDYDTLRSELPSTVEPAYDGLTITLDN
ncbi:MAG: MBL fold metallo-hydrolase [Hyphomicrobiales bacterium]